MSNQLAFARIYSTMKTIAPNSLISLISEEYEHQHAQCTCCNGPGKVKDKALAVIPGKSKGNEHGVCWNCGDKGHYKDKCPKPVVKKDNSLALLLQMLLYSQILMMMVLRLQTFKRSVVNVNSLYKFVRFC